VSAPAYTGDVEVGGPAAVRELPGLTISKLAVSEMANNAYLLRCTATGQALLVDAAAEPENLRTLIGDTDLRTVVTTHGHWDHHRALPEVVEATGAQTVAHPPTPRPPRPVQRTVEHGDTVAVGEQMLEVVHLRGHTPGSIALVWRGTRGRRRARLHRRQPLPGRSWEDNNSDRLHVADGRLGGTHLWPAGGRQPGSTPPREDSTLAPSGLTSRSGAPEVGDCAGSSGHPAQKLNRPELNRPAPPPG
jgi:hypothetical protein